MIYAQFFSENAHTAHRFRYQRRKNHSQSNLFQFDAVVVEKQIGERRRYAARDAAIDAAVHGGRLQFDERRRRQADVG